MKGLKVFCVWVLAITVTVVDGQSRIAFLKTREEKELDAKEWSANLNTISAPFQFVGTNMLVQVDLGHQKGLFLLDTGAPAVVINDPHPKAEVPANGVNAALNMEDTTIRFLKINQAEWKNVQAYALDLRQLETRNRTKILGLIGYNLLKKYELMIAPKEQMLYLLSADETTLASNNEPLAKTGFVLEDHLPILEVQIGGRTWKFGIDTGAESNLISEKCIRSLPASLYREKGVNNVRGLDKTVKACTMLDLHQLELADLKFEEVEFTTLNFDHITTSNGVQLDGLIGSDLLSKIKFSINYRKRIFKIWERY